MSQKARLNFMLSTAQPKEHKVLHKVRKHWEVIGLSLLVMLAGGALVSNATHADTTNTLNNRSNSIVNNIHPSNTDNTASQQSQEKRTFNNNDIQKQANTVHQQLLNNASKSLTTLPKDLSNNSKNNIVTHNVHYYPNVHKIATVSDTKHQAKRPLMLLGAGPQATIGPSDVKIGNQYTARYRYMDDKGHYIGTTGPVTMTIDSINNTNDGQDFNSSYGQLPIIDGYRPEYDDKGLVSDLSGSWPNYTENMPVHYVGHETINAMYKGRQVESWTTSDQIVSDKGDKIYLGSEDLGLHKYEIPNFSNIQIPISDGSVYLNAVPIPPNTSSINARINYQDTNTSTIVGQQNLNVNGTVDSSINVSNKLKVPSSYQRNSDGPVDVHIPSNHNDISMVPGMHAYLNGTTLTITGDATHWDSAHLNTSSDGSYTNHPGIYNKITTLNLGTVTNLKNLSNAFEQMPNLKAVNEVGDFDTSKVTDFSRMFFSDHNLTNITALSNWNTQSLTRTSDMFANDSNLSDISALSNWDTKNLSNIDNMFQNNTSLRNALPITKWNTQKIIQSTAPSPYFSKKVTVGGAFSKDSALEGHSLLPDSWYITPQDEFPWQIWGLIHDNGGIIENYKSAPNNQITLNYFYDGRKIGTGYRYVPSNVSPSDIKIGSNPEGIPQGYMAVNPSIRLNSNGTNVDVEPIERADVILTVPVKRTSTTDTIKFIRKGYGQIVGHPFTITGMGGTTANIDWSAHMPSSFSLMNDGTQNIQYDGHTHYVDVAVNSESDQINYTLSGSNIPSNYQGRTGTLSSISLSGDSGSSIPTSKYTNVPANYHIVSMPSLTYDGQTHDIQIAPNTENVNVTYIDQNGHHYAGSINGSYDQKLNNVTSDYNLPNGYHLNNNQDASYVFNNNTAQNKSLIITVNQKNINFTVTIKKYNGSTPEGTYTVNVPEQGDTGNTLQINPNQYAPNGYQAQQGVYNGSFTPTGVNQNNITFTYSAKAGSAITVNYINQNNNRIGGGSITGNVDDTGLIKNKLAVPNGYTVNNGQQTNYHIQVNPQAPINIHVTGLDSNQIPGNGTFSITTQKVVGDHMISSTNQQIHIPGHVGDNYTITPSNYTPTGYTSISNPVQGNITANGITDKSATFVYQANAGASINVSYKNNGQVIKNGSIKSLVDSTGNVYNQVPMPNYYHFTSSNVPGADSSNIDYHVTVNPQNIVINVSPDQATDTINFDYNGHQIASHQHTGNNVHAIGANDTSINDAGEVPAGWHTTSGTSFSYDGGTHTVDLQPNLVTDTIKYEDTGDNNQGHNYIGQQGTGTFTYNDNRATDAGNNSLTINANSKPSGLNSDFHVINTQTFNHQGGNYTDTVQVARDVVNDDINYVQAPSDGNADEEQHAHLLGSTPETLYADADYNLDDIKNTISVPDNDKISTPGDLTTNFHTMRLGAAPQDVNLPVFNLSSLENTIAGSTAAQYSSLTNARNTNVNSIDARLDAEKASQASTENSEATSAQDELNGLINELKNNSGASQAVQNNPDANASLSSYESKINQLLSDMHAHPANAGNDMRTIIQIEGKTNNIISSASNSASVSADFSSESVSTSNSATAQSTADSIARQQQSMSASSSASSVAASAQSALSSAQNSINNSAATQSTKDSLARSEAASSTATKFGSMTTSISNSAVAQSTADSIARSKASSAASSSVASLYSSANSSAVAHDSANINSYASNASNHANSNSSAIVDDPNASGIISSAEKALAAEKAAITSALATGNTSAADSLAAQASLDASFIDSAATSASTVASEAAHDVMNTANDANTAHSMSTHDQSAINNDPSASGIVNSADAALAELEAAERNAKMHGDASAADSYADQASNEASMINSAAVSAENAMSAETKDHSAMSTVASGADSMANQHSSAINADPDANTLISKEESALNSLQAAEEQAAKNGNTSAADSYTNQASNAASMIDSATVSAVNASSAETKDRNEVSAATSGAIDMARQQSSAISNDPKASTLISREESALNSLWTAEENAAKNGNTSAADSYTNQASNATSMINSATVSAANTSSAEAKDSNETSTAISGAVNAANQQSEAIANDPDAKEEINNAKSALNSLRNAEANAAKNGNASAANSYANQASVKASLVDSVANSAGYVYSEGAHDAMNTADDTSGANTMMNKYRSAINSNSALHGIVSSANDAMMGYVQAEKSASAAGNTTQADSYADQASTEASIIDSAAAQANNNSNATNNDTVTASNANNMVNSDYTKDALALFNDPAAKGIVTNARSMIEQYNQDVTSARSAGNISAADAYANAASQEAEIANSATYSAMTSSTGSAVASTASQSAESLSTATSSLSGSTESNTQSLNTQMMQDSYNATNYTFDTSQSLGNALTSNTNSLVSDMITNTDSLSAGLAGNTENLAEGIGRNTELIGRDVTSLGHNDSLALRQNTNNLSRVITNTTGSLSHTISTSANRLDNRIDHSNTQLENDYNALNHSIATKANLSRVFNDEIKLNKAEKTLGTKADKQQLVNAEQTLNASLSKKANKDDVARDKTQIDKSLSKIGNDVVKTSSNLDNKINSSNHALNHRIDGIKRSTVHNYNKLMKDISHKADISTVLNDEKRLNHDEAIIGTKADKKQIAAVEQKLNKDLNIQVNLGDIRNQLNVVKSDIANGTAYGNDDIQNLQESILNLTKPYSSKVNSNAPQTAKDNIYTSAQKRRTHIAGKSHTARKHNRRRNSARAWHVVKPSRVRVNAHTKNNPRLWHVTKPSTSTAKSYDLTNGNNQNQSWHVVEPSNSAIANNDDSIHNRQAWHSSEPLNDNISRATLDHTHTAMVQNGQKTLPKTGDSSNATTDGMAMVTMALMAGLGADVERKRRHGQD